jgi:hypothetical protein
MDLLIENKYIDALQLLELSAAIENRKNQGQTPINPCDSRLRRKPQSGSAVRSTLAALWYLSGWQSPSTKSRSPVATSHTDIPFSFEMAKRKLSKSKSGQGSSNWLAHLSGPSNARGVSVRLRSDTSGPGNHRVKRADVASKIRAAAIGSL